MSDVAGRLRELADAAPQTGPRLLTLDEQRNVLLVCADALDALAAMTTCKGPWNGTTEDGGDPAACPRCVSAGSAVLADAGRLLGDNT